MNNYCIYLKKKKGQPFCKLLNEEIPFCRCRECGRKEYKTKNLKISFYKTKPEKKQQIIKKRSKKLVKKEKNRYSVFTSKDKCFVCDSKYQLTWNEIFRGRNRINSMKYGFCLRMCLNCHRRLQEDIDFNDLWHKKAQLYYEENYGSRNEFINTFKRNYLD